ncbi:hypothetical protein Tco_0276082 [Tanacetum coccineum]
MEKGDKDTTLDEAPILMISRGGQISNRKLVEEPINEIREITFPLVSGINNSSYRVIIKAHISGRQVNRVYMDNGSSCEVIYEHCFLKLKPSIISLRVDSKIPLFGFSGEHSWPLREVPLEITIGDSSFTRMEVLDFVIIRSNSLYNILLKRTAMQRMGIVVSIIHMAIKFHTPRGIGTTFSMYEPDKIGGHKKLKEASPMVAKGILSCVDVEERIVFKDKYPEQIIIIVKQMATRVKQKLKDLLRSNADVFAWTYVDIKKIIIIVKQMPTRVKQKLHDLLRSNADVFAWTYVDIKGIPRTIMVVGKTFNTEHRLNEFKHIEPIKQKKRGLATERNEAICKEVEELTKANILREVKYQTWVSNPVMVKKDDGRWKLRVDFTYINKVCLKDCYPLPEVDQKV